MNWIPLNKYFVTGHEMEGMQRVIESGHLSGKGNASRMSEERIRGMGYRHARLAPSCTAALEAVALYLNIGPGDEVILPSYTFVASATAFANRGAAIVFADSRSDHPNLDCEQLESLITPRTKAIVLVHYAGISCDVDRARTLCARHNIALIDDAAHAFFSRTGNGELVGTQGDISCFSFHDTKNISCGEGGMIVWNKPEMIDAFAVLLNKGTNRDAFESGNASHYEWVGKGGSFGLSELQAAFLYYQLLQAGEITAMRREAWQYLHTHLQGLERAGSASLPVVNSDLHNAHIFYLKLNEPSQVDPFITYMKGKSVTCARHYYPLHLSKYGKQFVKHNQELPNAETFGNTLVRIPVYSGLTGEEKTRIVEAIRAYFKA